VKFFVNFWKELKVCVFLQKLTQKKEFYSIRLCVIRNIRRSNKRELEETGVFHIIACVALPVTRLVFVQRDK